jgi:hypothetical protein
MEHSTMISKELGLVTKDGLLRFDNQRDIEKYQITI